MQYKQTYRLFNEVPTPYFQEKHSTLIPKQRLNTATLQFLKFPTEFEFQCCHIPVFFPNFVLQCSYVHEGWLQFFPVTVTQ